MKKIKQDFSVKTKFSVKLISMDELRNIIKNIPNDKAVRGDIPINILKQCEFTKLKDCINNAFETAKTS